MHEPNQSSRRQFLAASAATTTVLAAGLSLSRSVHAAGSERFNVILVSAGGRGTGAAADCLRAAKHIKLVAIADAFEAQARLSRKSLQAMFGDQIDVPDERLFAGLDAFQKALACDADLMIQGTPSGVRPLHYRAAIEAGKHVFMEKPLCVEPGGFPSVMETNKLADQKNLKVGVGLFRRHMDTYRDAMKKLHAGEVGSSFTSILGREASYSGRVVKWDELAAQGPDLFPKRLAWDAAPPVLPDEHGGYEHKNIHAIGAAGGPRRFAGGLCDSAVMAARHRRQRDQESQRHESLHDFPPTSVLESNRRKFARADESPRWHRSFLNGETSPLGRGRLWTSNREMRPERLARRQLAAVGPIRIAL